MLTVAEGIVAALRQFGLSPLFITPNKEMSLLRKNSNSAVVIFNKNKQSRAATLTWEQIDRKVAEARVSVLTKQ
ncbi:hypothetical protein BOW53_08225 [Solemya pervernicosa gill symbiont]|uniref:Uncharacterized protein n=1 Tax=Solemya pervernicosa gill symbiont TaxID=642797 RepID=A0A1T2L5E6_9GAMM|nr:hypothetical protein BOW53_08225 [Solemya pervernicosa gill symbiont]